MRALGSWAIAFVIVMPWATIASAQSYDVVDLPIPAGITTVVPLEINNRGEVIGYANDRAVFWDQNHVPHEVVVPDANARYFQLDDLGRVGGVRRVNGTFRAFIWQSGVLIEPTFPDGAIVMTELTTSFAVYAGNTGNWIVQGNTVISVTTALGGCCQIDDVNSALFAVGSKSEGVRFQAMLRRANGIIETPFSDPGGYSSISVLGEGNHYAGTTGDPFTGPNRSRTWFGGPTGPAIQVIPPVQGRDPGTIVEFTEPNAINRSGDLVGHTQYSAPDGQHGFLYRNGQYIDLDSVAQGRSIAIAAGINDAGVIAVLLNGSAGVAPSVALLVPHAAPLGPPVLSATQVTTNPITLDWTPGSGTTAQAYTLLAGTSPGASNLGVFGLGLATSITAVAPVGLPLFIRIVEQTATGNATSNEIAFTVDAPSAPGAPTMHVPVVTGSTVQLSWSSSGPGVSYTLLARATQTGALIASAPVGSAKALTVPGVPSGTYFVSVVAQAGGQTSVESNQVVATVP